MLMQKKTIAIVTDNEAGLILASQLEQQGHSVTLLDTGDQALSRINRSRVALPFYPDTPEVRAALEKLNLTYETVEAAPISLDSGEMRPFIGFGDNKSLAVSTLSRFNVSTQLQVKTSVDERLSEIRSHLKAKAINYCELTRFDWLGDKIEKLVINGSQEIFADEFVFLISPREFLSFMSNDELGGRLRSRIAKTQNLARVTLEYQHAETPATLPSQDPIHLNPIFLIPNQADQEPCIGQIFTQQKSSIWETYIDNDLAEDAEYVSTVLKTMKRLIRRTITNLEEKPREYLTVTPASAADFSWVHEQKEFQKMAPNLLISPVLSYHHTGFIQCVIAAFAATQSLIERTSENLAVQDESEDAENRQPTLLN
jgi:hypothetical protein